MGISPSELENMTPHEFNLYKEGYQNRQIEHWEKVRFTAWITILSQGAKIDIHDVLPLPTDKKKIAKGQQKPAAILTKSQAKKIKELFPEGK